MKTSITLTIFDKELGERAQGSVPGFPELDFGYLNGIYAIYTLPEGWAVISEEGAGVPVVGFYFIRKGLAGQTESFSRFVNYQEFSSLAKAFGIPVHLCSPEIFAVLGLNSEFLELPGVSAFVDSHIFDSRGNPMVYTFSSN